MKLLLSISLPILTNSARCDNVAAGASHKMGKVQAPPKLNLKHFSGMQFETRSSLTLPTNLDKPFYIERSALARARGH